MDIRPQNTYRFQFKPPFTALGWSEAHPDRGIYTVLEIIGYTRLSELEIDLVNELYVPAGRTAQDMAADVAAHTFESAIFYRLRIPETETVRCVPSTIIEGLPRNDVQNYGKVLLGLDLGVVTDPTLVEPIRDLVIDLLKFEYGITPVFHLSVYGNAWLTEPEYAALDEQRKLTKAESALPTVLGPDVGSLNLIAENAKLRSQLQTARNRVAVLDAHLIQLQS